jgi:hypothetical protein
MSLCLDDGLNLARFSGFDGRYGRKWMKYAKDRQAGPRVSRRFPGRARPAQNLVSKVVATSPVEERSDF